MRNSRAAKTSDPKMVRASPAPRRISTQACGTWRGLQVELPLAAAGRLQPAKHEHAEVVHHRHPPGDGVETGEQALEENDVDDSHQKRPPHEQAP